MSRVGKRIYRRGNMLWCRLKDEHGKWISRSTGYKVGQEVEATAYQRQAQKNLDKRRRAGGTGPVTVESFAEQWIEQREELDLDFQNDESRLRLHVLPVIGELEIGDVTPRHLAKLFKSIRAEGKLAPRTIYNVYSVVSAMFRDATLDERLEGIVDESPCTLTEKQLGPLVDKDPEWRPAAVYQRDEVEALISDPRIPVDRQVLYALDFLAGVRHGEAAALRWRNYDAALEPLGRLTVATSYNSTKNRTKRTKTSATRLVPVHPVLAAMLAEWKLSGWPTMVGRVPGPDDLVVPLPPAAAARRRSRVGEPFRSKDYSGKRFREHDLPTLGFRHRRMHDARATFITLACDDGADRHVIEKRVTHTSKSRSAFDLYDRTQWETACREVAKLRITRRSGDDEMEFATPLLQATGTGGNNSGNCMEAPGVEPGSGNASAKASTCVAVGLRFARRDGQRQPARRASSF